MTPKDHLIGRLKTLCKTHGVDEVADRAGVSSENLKQIVAGTKLPSGRPRGVGPALQTKLEAAYPSWAGIAAPPPAKPPAGFKDRRIVNEADWSLLEDVKLVFNEDRIAELHREAQRLRSVIDKMLKDKMR